MAGAEFIQGGMTSEAAAEKSGIVKNGCVGEPFRRRRRAWTLCPGRGASRTRQWQRGRTSPWTRLCCTPTTDPAQAPRPDWRCRSRFRSRA
jgi:hypothetical protein